MATVIPSSSLAFLTELADNNNREWFTKAKPRYQDELLKIESFAQALLERMNVYDRLDTGSGKKALHRIYRDIRFSTDKTPYKINWSGGFKRMGAQRRGGYYFSIEPGNKTIVAGGFWAPNPGDLKLIRDEFAFDEEPIRKILASKQVRDYFGGLSGEKLKTVPRGFDKDHKAADLVSHKQFILQRAFTDKQVLAKNFIEEVVATMRALRPFFDYMSHALYVAE